LPLLTALTFANRNAHGRCRDHLREFRTLGSQWLTVDCRRRHDWESFAALMGYAGMNLPGSGPGRFS
jgi:hypothetical protein